MELSTDDSKEVMESMPMLSPQVMIEIEEQQSESECMKSSTPTQNDNFNTAESSDADSCDPLMERKDQIIVPEVLEINNDYPFSEENVTDAARPKCKVKKRKRKGLPRKATSNSSKHIKIMPLPNPNKIEVEETNIYAGNESNNPQLSLVDNSFTAKMAMRTPEERKMRPPIIMPMPVMKRTSLSLQDKVSIIKELEGGEKQATICKKRRLPKSTVQSIWKNREKIQASIDKVGMTRKRCRRAQHEDVEENLVQWIDSLKSQNVPVNGPQLRAKAKVVAKQMGLTEFRCSTGWLDKFKTRHNIVFKKSVKSPRSGAAGDRKVALDWVTKIWPTLCEGYAPENIFNADEMGLFYGATPEKVHRLKGETCHGGKMSKERITVLLCANSNGSEKIKPVVIGCKQFPKSFTGIVNTRNLPVEYFFHPKSWITRDVFSSWLKRWDETLRQSGRNILLVIDNSPVHSMTDVFTNIKLVSLPPIVASILQPLEHGVIYSVKIRYRCLLLDRLIRKCEQRISSFPAISLLESVSMLQTAWLEVKPALISDCFKNANLQSLNIVATTSLLSWSSTYSDDELLDNLYLIQQAIRTGISVPENVSLHEYAMIDSSLHVTDYINESNVLQSKPTIDDVVVDDTEDDYVQSICLPFKRDVQNFLDAIRSWAMISNTKCEDSIHEAISVLESFAVRHQSHATTSITNSNNISLNIVNTTTNSNVNLNELPISHNNHSASENISHSPGSTARLANSVNNNVIFNTSNISGSHMIQIPVGGQNQVLGSTVVTLTIDPQNNLSHAQVENHGQAHNSHNSNSSQHQSHHHHQQHHHQQQQQQFFAYLG